MARKDAMQGEIRARCDKRLEDEMLECAIKSMMESGEYIRAAIREKNERIKGK